ncbi:FkbM family methyltransferase [bacterium]|nr:FkbM family methyltransferase [bacterium]
MEHQTVFDENKRSFLETTFLRSRNISFIKTDTCIGKSLALGLYWELWMLPYIADNYIQETDMIDVGANIGTTSLLMAEILSPARSVHSFEPIYNDILLINVHDNDLKDIVKVYPYGIGKDSREMILEAIDLESDTNFGAMSIIEKQIEEMTERAHVKIKILPLDHFKFSDVSVIKIDVEGMESEVLEGMYDLIFRCRPTILLECFQPQEFQKTEIFQNLANLGYSMQQIPEGCFDFILKASTDPHRRN